MPLQTGSSGRRGCVECRMPAALLGQRETRTRRSCRRQRRASSNRQRPRAAEPQLASPSGRAARLKDRGRGFLSQDWRCIVQLLLSDEDVMPDTYQLNSIRVLRACIIKTSGEKLVQVHTQPGAMRPRAPRSRTQNASRVEKRMIKNSMTELKTIIFPQFSTCLK